MWENQQVWGSIMEPYSGVCASQPPRWLPGTFLAFVPLHSFPPTLCQVLAVLLEGHDSMSLGRLVYIGHCSSRYCERSHLPSHEGTHAVQEKEVLREEQRLPANSQHQLGSSTGLCESPQK